MNRIFGFLKQKLTQAKQQNKQQIQNLASVLTESEYSTQRTLTLLQSIKSNYINWNILIANQASTGLYYSQLHNRNICLRKIKGIQELARARDRNKEFVTHLRTLAKEVKQISALNTGWSLRVNQGLEGINQYVDFIKSKVNENTTNTNPDINNTSSQLPQEQSRSQSQPKTEQSIVQQQQQKQKQKQTKTQKQAQQILGAETNKEKNQEIIINQTQKQRQENIQEIVDQDS